MKVNELLAHGFEALSLPDGDREIDGVYIGDLLSWVMGRAQMDNAWITIMNNVNVIAVATLADTSCVILAEGVELPEELVETAREKDINVLRCELPIYETALRLAELVS
ncbi:MAG: DRTGG domain-containing protein [Coriobacteriales bacterium]|nr:DRTGG domain-containing protein [Coriobacteriales bacterium]